MKILAVTSGRADASPMRPVIEALRERGASTVVMKAASFCGSAHISAEMVNKAIVDHQPDLMLVLGDRYEILAAALAATVAKVPIAHIHGGEASFGSFDNQIRDAITKLSHIHFVATAQAGVRVMTRLGEQVHRVHHVGAPGLDNIAPILEEERDAGKYFVVTWHPETLGDDAGCAQMIEALKRFPDYEVFWSTPNNDPGAKAIRNLAADAGYIDWWSVSPDEYLRHAHNCAAVIGNSSSGIIEAPTLGVPTVNIGSRQDGREHGPSVFDARPTGGGDYHGYAKHIEFAINWALNYDYKFTNPYGEPGASAKIAEVLANIDLDGILLKTWT